MIFPRELKALLGQEREISYSALTLVISLQELYVERCFLSKCYLNAYLRHSISRRTNPKKRHHRQFRIWARRHCKNQHTRIDPNTGLINLPAEPVQPQVASGCTAGTGQNQSKFVVTGRGGLPLNPREAFNNNDTVRVDWVTLSPNSDNRNQTVTTTIPTPAPIVEATGWVINAKGEVFLTASAPTGTPHSSWQRPTTCGALK
jgi:hypothetical protein